MLKYDAPDSVGGFYLNCSYGEDRVLLAQRLTGRHLAHLPASLLHLGTHIRPPRPVLASDIASRRKLERAAKERDKRHQAYQ